MKIGIDVRCLTNGRLSGVEEYTKSLIKALLALDRKNEYILFCNAYGKIYDDFSWATIYPNVTLKRFRFPNKIFNFILWYWRRPFLDKLIGGVDWLWMPNIMFTSVSRQTKLLLTIHDLSFLHFFNTFSWKRRFWHWLVNPRKIIERADEIVAVSRFTQKDIANNYNFKKNIRAVSSGLNEKFRLINRNDIKMLSAKEKYSLPYKFMLFLGTLEPRKNIVAIIRAFEYFRQWANNLNDEESKKFKLVLAGRKGWLHEEIFSAMNNSVERENILFIDGVDEEDKEYVISLSSLFIYPSQYEGFGFPPLEAMKCEIPVIASNTSAMPEVLGEAPIFIDPDKPAEIFEAMRQIISSPSLKEKMKKEGKNQANQFSWETSAKEMLKIFSA